MPKAIIRSAFIGAWVSLLVLCCNRTEPHKTTGPELSEHPVHTTPEKQLDYIEIYTGGAIPNSDTPVVFALHGLGDTPENFSELFRDYRGKAKIVAPRAPISYGPGFAWFLTRLSSGNWDSLAREISHAAKQVVSLIGNFRENGRAKDPPILCGFSQGAMISFAIALNAPKTVSASVPISGFLPAALFPKTLKNAISYPKIHALHGDSDLLIPVVHAQTSVDRMQKLGIRATLEKFKGTPHTINRSMRNRLFRLLDMYISPNDAIR